MSSNCSFEQHIIELCKWCTGLCGWILRTFSSRESTVMMTLFKSLVLSRLDYGSQLWSPTKIHQIIMIEKIQKASTKHIKGFSSFSYQEIYSLQCRRERYIIIYVWKILDNLVPNLVKPLQFYVSDRRGRLCSVSHVRLGHWLILALGGGSNDSRLHVVEPPRGRSFIWQIGVNSSIQDRRQVDRGFFMELSQLYAATLTHYSTEPLTTVVRKDVRHAQFAHSFENRRIKCS